MVRLIGFILGTISGISLLVSFLMLFYQLFVVSSDDYSSNGEELGIISSIFVFSLLVFFYTFQTGFGKSRLERTKEQFEVLKIKHEINRMKNG